jgi:hypothetical protein
MKTRGQEKSYAEGRKDMGKIEGGRALGTQRLM